MHGNLRKGRSLNRREALDTDLAFWSERVGREYAGFAETVAGTAASSEAAAAYAERIRNAAESYIWVQTATGIMIGVLSWALMWACGLPQPSWLGRGSRVGSQRRRCLARTR